MSTEKKEKQTETTKKPKVKGKRITTGVRGGAPGGDPTLSTGAGHGGSSVSLNPVSSTSASGGGAGGWSRASNHAARLR